MINLSGPRDGQTHTLADFAEILCLVTQDRTCSRDYVADYIKDATDKKIPDERLDDCFAQLGWRSACFGGGSYAFAIDEHDRILTAARDLTVPQQLYVLLLLCANLPVLTNGIGAMTDTFERVALEAVRRIWPSAGICRPFGKNETDYVGKKWERLNQLARDIGGNGILTEKAYKKHDNGDGGIDIAAWLDLDSFEKRNIPSALAQCACSREDWSKKQSEISVSRLNQTLYPSHGWMEIIAIPHSFRDNTGEWAVPGEVCGTVILDRLRIVRQIGDDIDWAALDAPPLLGEFLAYRLPQV